MVFRVKLSKQVDIYVGQTDGGKDGKWKIGNGEGGKLARKEKRVAPHSYRTIEVVGLCIDSK